MEVYNENFREGLAERNVTDLKGKIKAILSKIRLKISRIQKIIVIVYWCTK